MKTSRKTRRGCFSCKSRKVKCSEERPTCRGCARQNLSCVYPDLYINATRQDRSAIVSRVSLHRSLDSAMNPADLRLFNHFLVYALPRVPLGNDQIWAVEVAARAHHSSVLMHAILGVAASHLVAIQAPGVTSSIALWHRQMAMDGVQKAITRLDEQTSLVEIDSTLAASYALAQQCSNMDDAVADSLVLYRGCEALAKIAADRRQGTSSKSIFQGCDGQLDLILSASADLGLGSMDSGISHSMRASLLSFRGLCHKSPFSELHEMLSAIASAFCEDWRRGPEAIGRIWGYINSLPGSEAAKIMDGDSPVTRLLCAHLLAVTLLYDRFRIATDMEMAKHSPVQKPVSWMVGLCETLYADPNYRAMAKWPKQVASVAQRLQGQNVWLPVATLWNFVDAHPESFY